MYYLETIDNKRYLNLRSSLTDSKIDYIHENNVTTLNIKEYEPWDLSDEGVSKLGSAITVLNAYDTETPLSFINNLPLLKKLTLSDFSAKKISAIDFANLHNLNVLHIDTAKKIPHSLSECHHLKILHINGKAAFDNNSQLDQVQTLIVSQFGNFGTTGNLKYFPKLKNLRISRSRCKDLRLDGCTRSIENVYAEFFPCCEDLTPLQKMDIKKLHLSDFKNLTKLNALSHVRNLQDIIIENAQSLQSILPLSECNNLRRICLHKCPEIASLTSLANCTNLEAVSFYEGTQIKDGKISFLLDIPTLEKLRFDDHKNFDLTYGEIQNNYDNDESCWTKPI